ncbi:MAG: thioesterase family protein [Prevotella sp.]|nr:thioesterase family protein [Prevotella sp.]MBQ8629321.1 thioesterase family protein [Prevotella sp.]MEE1093051.1 thioesterase family protein [Prevotella sp.]
MTNETSNKMTPGVKNSITLKVENSHTAKAAGSGTLDVLATPIVIALIEETAWKSVSGLLSEEESTVGTLINIEHIAPTPMGGSVTCHTELTKVEGRKLTFEAIVKDNAGIIARGHHQRFVINTEKFMRKVDEKKTAAHI